MNAQTTTKKFLEVGSPLRTTVNLLKGNKYIKISNPEKLVTSMIPMGSLGRIHSRKQNSFIIWILEENTYSPLIIEVPSNLMGNYFQQHHHGIFPHLAS